MDPLAYYLETIGYESKKVKQFFIGEKYAIAELNDGYCGVCGHTIDVLQVAVPSALNLNENTHRLLYVCYLNALLNRHCSHLPTSSFVEQLNEYNFKQIVMIGYFKPLLKRYQEWGIKPIIFDHNKDDQTLTPMAEQAYWLKKADLVIMSATTLANNTFNQIISNINSQTKDAFTGPSSILHHDFFRFLPNGIISGMLFEPGNQELIDCIKAGHGTQYFKRFGKKVDLYQSELVGKEPC